MKKSIIVLLIVLLLGACGKSVSPEETFRNAYVKQSSLSSYGADATVKMDAGPAGTHEFYYKMNVEKDTDLSQEDDAIYYDFSCTVEGDDPYSRWMLGNGTVLTDTGSEKLLEPNHIIDAGEPPFHAARSG